MSGREASRGPAARVERLELAAGGVRLSVADFGGPGRAVVLLHGLAGHGEEWLDTAGPLAATHRVIAPDARGHGFSEGNPPDVSAAAHVADAAAAIDELHLGPAVLVGQSLGGLTAMALAAEHPEVVAALVMVEAGPEAANDGDLGAAAAWLASWPVPFSDRTAAERFFGGSQLRARRWADGLQTSPDGLRPQFDPEVLIETNRAIAGRSYWREWGLLGCPTLVVTAQHGDVPATELERMAATNPQADFVSIDEAGHDLHLDAPDALMRVLSDFLKSF